MRTYPHLYLCTGFAIEAFHGTEWIAWFMLVMYLYYSIFGSDHG